jgi:hypothetical protein
MDKLLPNPFLQINEKPSKVTVKRKPKSKDKN